MSICDLGCLLSFPDIHQSKIEKMIFSSWMKRSWRGSVAFDEAAKLFDFPYQRYDSGQLCVPMSVRCNEIGPKPFLHRSFSYCHEVSAKGEVLDSIAASCTRSRLRCASGRCLDEEVALRSSKQIASALFVPSLTS